MAIKYMFFDHEDYDRQYNAQDWADYFRHIITNGVLNNGDNLKVHADGTSRKVKVMPGVAWINGRFFMSTEEIQLELSEAHGTYNRYDRIVLKLDLRQHARNIKLVVKSGTPGNGKPPALERTSEIYELGLAEVLVEANTSLVPNSNIKDTRDDEESCGIVNINLDYTMFAKSNDVGDIHDSELPSQMRGKTIVEQLKYLSVEGGKVKSVNGKTGNVVLNAGDISETSNRKWVNSSEKSKLPYLKSIISTTSTLHKETTEHTAQLCASKYSTVGGKYVQINASDQCTIEPYTSDVAETCQVNASSDCKMSYFRSQINASTGCKNGAGDTQINCSWKSEAGARNSQINACWGGSTVNDGDSRHIQMNACDECVAGGKYNVIDASKSCESQHQTSAIIASRHTTNRNEYTVTGGYGIDSTSEKNIKWEINSKQGTIKASGSITGNSSFDYAEYLESATGESIPVGTIVTLHGDKIKLANKGDEMLGIISGTAGVVLNDSDFCWQGRYLRDEFGQYVYEYIKDPNWEPREGETEDDRPLIKAHVKNPGYDDGKQYIPRKDRPEWCVVGLIGQIYTRIDDTVTEGDFISACNGIATKNIKPEYTRWKVMKITTPYSKEKGYGVAKVFVK